MALEDLSRTIIYLLSSENNSSNHGDISFRSYVSKRRNNKNQKNSSMALMVEQQ